MPSIPNPNALRKLLQALAKKEELAPTSDTIPLNATRPVVGARGQGPGQLQDSLGVAPDDIFDTPGHNIVMGDKAAQQSREFVTGSPIRESEDLNIFQELDNPGQSVIDEIDANQVSRNKAEARKQNPNLSRTGAQGIRDRSQLDNLGISQDEQRLLDEANRVTHKIKEAQAAKANNIPERTIASAKAFGRNENINAYVQDVFSRFKEMFDTDVLGAARTQGSAASKLRDEFKTLSEAARDLRNPNLNPKHIDSFLKKVVDIDNKLSGSDQSMIPSHKTVEDVKLDWEIGEIAPEVNKRSVKHNEQTELVSDIQTDKGVEFSGRSNLNELGPLRTPSAQTLQGNKGFNPNQLPTNMSTTPDAALNDQNALIQILREIQQGNN